jgi:hypothetical protein
MANSHRGSVDPEVLAYYWQSGCCSPNFGDQATLDRIRSFHAHSVYQTQVCPMGNAADSVAPIATMRRAQESRIPQRNDSDLGCVSPVSNLAACQPLPPAAPRICKNRFVSHLLIAMPEKRGHHHHLAVGDFRQCARKRDCPCDTEPDDVVAPSRAILMPFICSRFF